MTEMIFPRQNLFHFDKWANFDETQDIDPDLLNTRRADGTVIYQPVDQRNPGWQRYTSWADLGPWGKQLRGMQTRIVYVSPDGRRVWNLSGPWAGKEGVVLDTHLQGAFHVPFEQRYVSGAYMIGETLERTDYRKRAMNLGVIIGPSINYLARQRFPDNEFAYRMIEEQWWQDWPEHHLQPAGFIGEFTRSHGWRWIRPRQGEYNDQAIELDPAAYGNNAQSWAMTIHAEFPFYSKRAWVREWRNDKDNALISGRNHGEISVVNRGDWPQWIKFVVEGGGTVTLQDGITDRMVELPKINDSDGMVLVDTDPAARTLTGEHDFADAALANSIANGNLLDYLLGDVSQSDSGLPVGRRMPGGIGFMSQLPAHSTARIKVTHTSTHGKITAIVPQWYKMGAS